MKQWAPKQNGFTIVELIVVIVVIAILAAITIVSYRGITDQARTTVLKDALSSAHDKVVIYSSSHSGRFPDSLAEVGIFDSNSVTFQYTSDNTTTPRYAITAADSPASSNTYYVSSTQRTITQGTAPGHNLIVWDKSSSSSMPVLASSGVTMDSSVYRTSTASTRLSPGAVGKPLRSTPITGEVGQVVTVSFWLRTDSSWNGLGNNSKIRYGGNGGALLAACGYNGVKTTWTFVTCSRAITAGEPNLTISVGNDGTVGNIWIDDLSLSIQ